jgi:hypothetical protein
MTVCRVVVAVTVLLAALNVRGTVRLWRSDLYSRGQQLAQTIMLWILPGSVFVVTYLLAEPSLPDEGDPTSRNPETPNGNATCGAGHV